ncbi:MAG: hypothetical protein JW748_13925 [Anaerolineales bacterium]|nr:hypothetical protein [Anaerolineales bacterium]
MKRTNIPAFIILAALMLGLTACGGGTAPAGGAGTAVRLNTEYENALPAESQLILGTLLLEDTENAVTPEQAEALLPMWMMMKELTVSDTAATQEKGGLIEQIQETMTAQQIQAIAEMKLTQEDVFAYMQKAGLTQMPRMSGTPDASGTQFFPGGMAGEPPAGFEGGGMPGGGGVGRQGGGEGGGFNPNQELSAEQIATMEARRSERSGFGGSSTALLDVLIQILEGKQIA